MLMPYHLLILHLLQLLKCCVISLTIKNIDQRKALTKLWKMFFILPKKLLSFMRNLVFCISLFPYSFTCWQLLNLLEVWISINPQVYVAIILELKTLIV